MLYDQSLDLRIVGGMRMNYRLDVFTQQFPIVKRFVYHLIYYRELWAAYHRLQFKSEFWTHTIDAHLLQAAIYWCMIFGSHGCNPIHWKHLSEKESEELQASFRKGLSSQTGLTKEQWQQYWNDITDFRNRYAAHRELDFAKPVPDFTTALEIAFYYDHWIREVISPDFFEEPMLEETAQALRKSVAPLINQLLEHTKKYDDSSHQVT